MSKGLGRVICDGSPGIGCLVIASLTGDSLALIVAIWHRVEKRLRTGTPSRRGGLTQVEVK
ncbi:MAG: hypothetical protein HQ581_20105 [Planctomycetes bacterium]|nr:hypothetical protein [Planctomycetota bacterium]